MMASGSTSRRPSFQYSIIPIAKLSSLTKTYGLDEKLVGYSELCGDSIYAKP
jgi:hypothetical protein